MQRLVRVQTASHLVPQRMMQAALGLIQPLQCVLLREIGHSHRRSLVCHVMMTMKPIHSSIPTIPMLG